MVLHYDDKGKFYTNYVNKDSICAVIQTTTHRIEGMIYVRAGERVSDELNSSGQFLSVTNATVFDHKTGEVMKQCPFLAVNSNMIVWLQPKEEEAGGPEQ